MIRRIAAIFCITLVGAILGGRELGGASGPPDPVATARAHLDAAGVRSWPLSVLSLAIAISSNILC